MPTTITTTAAPQSQESPTLPPLAIWSLLLLVLVLVVLLVGAGLVYVTWRHPSLGAPLGVAVAGVTSLVTIALTLALSRR